jgi:signal transduction histidine kinase
MKWTFAAAALVPLALLLLTWLSVRAADADADLFDRALGILDEFANVENELHRDVLSARAGMLRNYDPLVREVDALDDALGRLRETAAADAEVVAGIARLRSMVNEQEALIEQFKSDNALLQNSLAYFGRFSTDLGAAVQNEKLVAAVSALAAAMLHLTLDTSPQIAHEVADRLDDVVAQSGPSDASSIEPLLAHARLLHRLLPATDHALKALFTVRSGAEQEAIREMVVRHQQASRATARAFRSLLYLISVLLLGLLVHLAVRLRAGALALRRRAALEHALAGISTRFINVQTKEIDACVGQALAELANCVAADRAYFLVRGAPTHSWCRHGATYPSGWPDKVTSMIRAFNPTNEGIIWVPRVDRLSAGELKDLLTAANVHFWACVASLAGDEIIGILGFDALWSSFSIGVDEFGLLRMAVDAIGSAMKREFLEQERARLETDLQRARRMETVGALTGGIAHNFNNIVGAVLGHVEMAEAHISAESRAGHNLAAIRRAAERAQDLIDQLLTFGRRRDPRRSFVRVGELIDETVSLLRVSLPTEVNLIVCETSGNVVVSGSPAQLQQVLLNFCNNASHAMDGKGRIEIRTEIHEIARAESLSHGDLAPGRYVQIAVSDAGRGMDKRTLEQLFKPFFTTRLGGNGLGLATVREIVREHAGAINVDSTVGVGSRFEAWLPCVHTATASPRDNLVALPLGGGETLMVIDDERERLLQDEEILAALGYEPIGFIRPEDALAACRATPKRFDAAVIGHFARAMAALELAAALHEIAPALPILLAATSVRAVGASTLVAAGISDVVGWPFASSEIAVAIKGCLTMRHRD